MHRNDIHHYHGRVSEMWRRANSTTRLMNGQERDRVGSIVRLSRDQFAMKVFVTEAVSLVDELDRQYPVQRVLEWGA